MLWRSGNLVIAQRGDSFAVVEASGEVSHWFCPHSSSDEDDLWLTTHRVVGEQLVRRTVIERAFAEERVFEEIVVVHDLRAIDDAGTQRFVDDALVADDDVRALQRQHQQREADARVTSIPGALADLGLGASAARAQRALCERVRAWNDARAAALLRTLVDLARARPDAAVVTAYARGCLFACFEVDVPEPAKAAPVSSHPRLAHAIAVHAAEIEAAADGQAAVDAHRNAASLWSAARALRLAASLLS